MCNSKIGFIFYIIYRNYFRVDYRFKIRIKIIKFLEENIRINFGYFRLGKFF